MATLPTPALLLVVFVTFLAVLAGLGIAVTKTVAPDGRAARGFFGTIGSILALLFLCGLGIVGTGLFAASLAFATAVEENPIRSIEVFRDDAPGQPLLYEGRGDDVLPSATYGTEGMVHFIFTVDEGAGGELVSFVQDLFGLSPRELERAITVTSHEGFDVWDLAVPISDDELTDLERDIERELDGVDIDLPDGVRIEFRGASRGCK